MEGRARGAGWRVVVAPFVFTRLLFAVVLFVGHRGTPPGWILESARSLFARNLLRFADALCRWDCGWYLSIVEGGYRPEPFLRGEQANVAFFPGYPQLVRRLWLALPAGWQTHTAAILLGLLVANGFAIAALWVLHRHVRERFGDEVGASAVLLLLAFPTAFYLSCLYTEGLFLFLAVVAWHGAWNRRWALAGAAGLALALTRPNGMLFAAPLGWIYLDQIGFDPRRLRANVLWLLLLPLGFLAYGAWLAHATGDLFAVLHVQRAWGKEAVGAATTILDTKRTYGPMTDFDRAVTILFGVAALLMLRAREHRAGAVAVLATLAAFAFTGTLRSASRYLLVAFPVFIWLAATTTERTRRWVLAGCWAVQIALLLTFARGEWVG